MAGMAAMKKLALTRNIDSWELVLLEYSIVLEYSEWLTTLTFCNTLEKYILQIESPLKLDLVIGKSMKFGPKFDVAERNDLEFTTGSKVGKLTMYDNGDLNALFEDGNKISVEGSDNFEAWNLTGPRDLRIVSEPGRNLGVWLSN
jgi:hypothetical protein